MAIAAAIALGIGAAGGISIGNLIFPGHIPQPDLSRYSIDADEDESVPAPPPPKGNTVQGKPRNFLPYAPSWAKHPDYDRVLWMNKTLSTLWPYYNAAVGQQVLEQVTPIIAEQLKPYPFIQGVDIERIDLGDRPPAIGGAKTFTSSADEAILEAPLMWGSNVRVRVAVRIKVLSYVLYIPVEVANVQLRADARITLAPLVDVLPCLGAVTVTMLDAPYFDLSASLIGALDLMSLPGIRDAVQAIAHKVLGDMLVYPNRMTFDIMPNGGNPPDPTGMLVLRIKSVSDIKGGSDWFSKVDPLVEVSVRDGRSLKTKKVKNNANPEFDEVMTFIVDDPDTQTITAFLREADFAFSKTMGVCEVPLSTAEFMKEPRKVVQLDVPMFKPEAHGHLLKLAKVGARGSSATKDVAGKMMGGAHGEEADKVADAEDSHDALNEDLAHLHEGRGAKAVVGQLHMEAQYCPFAATGEDAHPDAAHIKAQKEKHNVVRRMTRSNISHEHKGVLTVTLVGASGLTTEEAVPEGQYSGRLSLFSHLQTPEEKGDVDPFVELKLFDPARNETEVQQSTHLVNEVNPKWGEKFDFVMASATSVLTVDVWDTLNWLEGRFSLKGLTGRKETKQRIGTLRLPVAEVVRNGKIRDTWALQDTQKGDIALSLVWTTVQLDADSDIKRAHDDGAHDEEKDQEPLGGMADRGMTEPQDGQLVGEE